MSIAMATTRISSLYPFDATQWRQLLRATLRECTYLPDPIARNYMRHYVLDRYRRARHSNRPESQLIQTAKRGLSILKRANEGYPRPFDKVMLTSYGRIGKRRHELLLKMLETPVPKDHRAVKELVNQPEQFSDDWKPPQIVVNLMKSQMSHGVYTSSRIRRQLKVVEPPIPETNTWGKPVARCRRVNIRRKWYTETLYSLLPPLPEEDIRTLEGLMSGSITWAPVKRRKAPPTIPQAQNSLLDFLTIGPQKRHTFREYVNGRPHKFTRRFMHRQWRRISSFVPRLSINPRSGNWLITWDTPKSLPPLSFDLKEEAYNDDIFWTEVRVFKNSPKQAPEGADISGRDS